MLVDRPGRGYADDYTPWLVERPVGELVPCEAVAVTEEGVLAACRSLTASSATSPARASTSHAADGFVAIRDIDPQAETHLLVLPERHVDTFREIDEFPRRGEADARFVAETARAAGLDDYRVIVNVGPAAARRSSTCTGTSGWEDSRGATERELTADVAVT